ncbi:MAG: histidine--tRNA ligase [Akkermansiaceae bacterium]|nr:histidine--tRNA ligase [Akkermansiaceae bacterium]
MASSFQPLPGFRDFAPRERLLSRYLFEAWAAVAGRYGFSEFEAPIVESAELYLKKSGGELSTQLFRFEDQGGRDVVLRPELTASLARIAAAQQRDYPKPLKWFEIGRCFRYEKPQRGRLREFYQFNADILGEPSPAADAELVALAIDVMRELGFSDADFTVRLSDREVWRQFAADRGIDDLDAFLQVVDKIERDPEERLTARLEPFGVTLDGVRSFIADDANRSPNLVAIMDDLEARGLGAFVNVDLSVVRGLAYYTGVVFEVFDSRKALRSVAGGGRYDSLVSLLTDGGSDLPATGYAMGDCVIAELINDTPQALLRLQAWQQRQAACDVFLVIADEARRPDALALAARLRDGGIAVDFPLTPTKINKQFKAADQSLARFALVVGSEYPELKLKILAARTEEAIYPNADPVEVIRDRLARPDGPLIA